MVDEHTFKVWLAFDLASRDWLSLKEISEFTPGGRDKLKYRVNLCLRYGALIPDSSNPPNYKRADPATNEMAETFELARKYYQRTPLPPKPKPDMFPTIADPDSSDFDIEATMETLKENPEWLSKPEMLKLIQHLHGRKMDEGWPYTDKTVKPRPGWMRQESRSNPDWNPPPKTVARNIVRS